MTDDTFASGLDDDTLIEGLLVALIWGPESHTAALLHEVQRRGLVARAQQRAGEQTRENRRRLGDNGNARSSSNG